MLLHRYATEFTDDGSRALLPTLRMGFGVTTVTNRFVGTSLGIVDAAIPTWPAIAGDRTLGNSTVPAKQPLVKSVSGIKYAQFDGVDDALISSPTWTGYVGPPTVTLILRVRSIVAGKCAVLLGGGMLEMDTSGVLRCWWNGHPADGGGTTGLPRFLSTVPVDTSKFMVVSVTAPDGLDNHELSVGKTHVRDESGRTKRGVSQICLGGDNNTNVSAIDVVDVVGWDHVLTRVERETLVDSYKAIYPDLPFL
jgi:hypothetical protein